MSDPIATTEKLSWFDARIENDRLRDVEKMRLICDGERGRFCLLSLRTQDFWSRYRPRYRWSRVDRRNDSRATSLPVQMPTFVAGCSRRLDQLDDTKSGLFGQRATGKYIYAIGAGPEHPVKIGYTSNLKRRLSALQSASPVALSIEAQVSCRTENYDRTIHEVLEGRSHGEWFGRTYENLSRLRFLGLHIGGQHVLSPEEMELSRVQYFCCGAAGAGQLESATTAQ